MKAKKLIAFFFCLVTVVALCTLVSFAECEHSEDNYKWETTMQTCSSAGKQELVCAVCGDVKESEIIPAHNYSVIFTGKAATCTEQGSVTVYCSWCRNLENQITPKDYNNHSYGEWITDKEPTCKTEGEKHRVCSKCGYVETVSIAADISKHVAGEGNVWTTVTAATCYSVGRESTTCTVCGSVFSRDIPIHSNPEVSDRYKVVSETVATCTKAATVQYQCLDCAANFVVTGEKDMTAHDFTVESKWVYSEGATCQNPGTVTKHCNNTYAHTQVEVYAPHDFSGEETVITAAGCSNDGEKTVQCLYCDETETVIISAEHILGDWIIKQGGSCAYGGTASRYCPCGAKSEENVEFAAGTHLNYDVVTDVKPTCLYLGYQWVDCKVCNSTVQLFPAEYAETGHTSSAWITTDPATCEKSGTEIRKCLTCDEVLESKVIVQLSHSCIVLEEGIEATCTTAGKTPYLYCTQCEKMFEQEVIPASGHNFVEQNYNGSISEMICDRCYQYKVDGDDENPVICDCLCHNSDGIAKTLYKFITFFNKLFGINQFCGCGAQHYEDTSIFEDIFGSLLK